MLHPETLINGQEQHEQFYVHHLRKNFVQYDYRHTDGELFSCVAPSLEKCIQKRNAWINKKVTN